MHPGFFIGQKALRNVIFYRAVKGAKYDEKITRMVGLLLRFQCAE